MIDKLISFSIRNKLIIGMFVVGLIGWGIYSIRQIPIDAVPDITTNQVQVITQSPTLAAQEVEQFITFPIELAMANLPEVEEIRSVSRFGLSVITVVFSDDMDSYLARQLISEQLKTAERSIPKGLGSPELGPITTGLGEVYQYVIHTEPGFEEVYSDMDLRTINDWIVKRQLAGTPGVIEVNGWGGHLKQYEVAVEPDKLNSMHISLSDVFTALEANNENTGGSYIEKRFSTYFIRGEGLVKSLDDIRNIVVKNVNGVPVLMKDVADVGYGSAPRYGAITWNGHGEVVGGQTLMLKGENSYEVVQAVKERIEEVKKSLPEGVVIEPYIDRSKLIGRAIDTVTKNLVEGGLIVIFVLILLLGNLRGGLIVASVIPLSMLFALCMMDLFDVSANLMSLGAIDFGLIVDGSVIIVEAIIHRIYSKFSGSNLSQAQMDAEVNTASSRIRSSAAFGEIIILIVYLPILALVGIEGKMFKPMAQTVSFAIAGALILSMTYVPMMSALFLNKKIRSKVTLSDRIIKKLQSWYDPVINFALRKKSLVITVALALFGMSLFTFTRLGGEFIPTLDEGDLALHQILPPGSSLQQSIEVSEKIQRTLLESFPEVEMVVSKIGSAEIPTDPMPIEVGDIMVRMKPKEEWVSAGDREELFEKMKEKLNQIPGITYEFTQPIQMRFNELIAGVREDIAIKIFGENPDVLFKKAKEAEQLIKGIDGIGDTRVEQTQGLPQMKITYDRAKLAQYGLNIRELNTAIRVAFAGQATGVVFEGERRFDLVVRLHEKSRGNLEDIKNLLIPLPTGDQVPLGQVANVKIDNGPMQISREDTRRKIMVGVNARNRDTESLVKDIQARLEEQLVLPAGYEIQYGGQFENLVNAKRRLAVAVPVALLLIMVLLFFTFKSVKQAILIFTAIPLSAIGGVYALWLRDMPFSISAGVGFIALFGVAVLNGIVLIAYFNQLKKEGVTDIRERVLMGTNVRLRPVVMTASVAALGFLPMAISGSAGAEVQRPLATVVIGGLVTATLLTLVVLPVLYSLTEKWSGKISISKNAGILLLGLLSLGALNGQSQDVLTVDQAVKMAVDNHPMIKTAALEVEKQNKLRKSALDLQDLQIKYSVGEINSTFKRDYQWQITQNFKFPLTYVRQYQLQSHNVSLSEQQLELMKVELERNVRQSWYQLAYGLKKLELMKGLVNTYKLFAEVAEKRFKSGETNMLERVNAVGKYKQVSLEYDKAKADVAIYQSELAKWLGSDTIVELPKDGFTQIPIPMVDTMANATSPIIAYYQSAKEVAEYNFKAARSGFFPGLSVGYLNQQIDGTAGLQGLQFGVGIPIFFWAKQGHVQAAKIGRQQAFSMLQDQQLRVGSDIQKQLKNARKYLAEVAWYEAQGLKMAEVLSASAHKSYQNGEIDYIEYMNSVDQVITLKKGYLDALNLYNTAAIEVQYLTGMFSN